MSSFFCVTAVYLSTTTVIVLKCKKISGKIIDLYFVGVTEKRFLGCIAILSTIMTRCRKLHFASFFDASRYIDHF